jgi:hypothetical protein
MIRPVERLTGKYADESGGGLFFTYYACICLEGLRKTTKTAVRIPGLRADI